MARLLTVAAVQRLRPTTQRREIRDGGAPGLYLVIQSSGHKSWAMRVSRVDGRSAKLTLGPCDLTGRDPDGGHDLADIERWERTRIVAASQR